MGTIHQEKKKRIKGDSCLSTEEYCLPYLVIQIFFLRFGLIKKKTNFKMISRSTNFFQLYLLVKLCFFFFFFKSTWCIILSFQTFFVLAFEIVVDSWKFSILLLCILWDDWPIFMISDSNEQLQQQLEYTLLKPDCPSWWISKIQSGRQDTLEERYAIKFCFKLGKNDATSSTRVGCATRPIFKQCFIGLNCEFFFS